MKILDVGCGVNKTSGSIGLDNNPRTGADVIHDLGQIPYPFTDNEFDLVVSNHVIEHIPDVMAFVSELHRITKNGGTIKILTPHYTSAAAARPSPAAPVGTACSCSTPRQRAD